jgi:FdhD protein
LNWHSPYAPPGTPGADLRLSATAVGVQAGSGGTLEEAIDQVAVEEPLEIRLRTPAGTSRLSVTMRTPGHDFELVAGFLLAEGVIDGRDELLEVAYCLDDAGTTALQRYNVVTAVLADAPRRSNMERLVMTSSACGICGAASIDAVRVAGHPRIRTSPTFTLEQVTTFPDRLRDGQRTFEVTGGVHGIALLDGDTKVLCLREDVGGHNAVDKVVGWGLLDGRLPLSESALMVSGRISFEIVQKALRAGIPLVAGISAATSLAVALAEDVGITLVGFLRGSRCTIYSGAARITCP